MHHHESPTARAIQNRVQNATENKLLRLADQLKTGGRVLEPKVAFHTERRPDLPATVIPRRNFGIGRHPYKEHAGTSVWLPSSYFNPTLSAVDS